MSALFDIHLGCHCTPSTEDRAASVPNTPPLQYISELSITLPRIVVIAFADDDNDPRALVAERVSFWDLSRQLALLGSSHQLTAPMPSMPTTRSSLSSGIVVTPSSINRRSRSVNLGERAGTPRIRFFLMTNSACSFSHFASHLEPLPTHLIPRASPHIIGIYRPTDRHLLLQHAHFVLEYDEFLCPFLQFIGDQS